MAYTEERKTEILQESKKSLDGMEKDLLYVAQKLGDEHGGVKKMRSMLDIMRTISEQEVLDVAEVMEELMQKEELDV